MNLGDELERAYVIKDFDGRNGASYDVYYVNKLTVRNSVLSDVKPNNGHSLVVKPSAKSQIARSVQYAGTAP